MNKSSGHRFLLALLNPRGKPPTLLQAACATAIILSPLCAPDTRSGVWTVLHRAPPGFHLWVTAIRSSFMSLNPSQHEGWTCNGGPTHGVDAVALGGVKQTDVLVYDSEQSAAGI